ncbi:MAG TPA: phosphatase PAP2 family protein [Phycisphaerae bacterium]|nr:phosphatase PAP2 family protein [Phycisphaerae bacterium]
MVMRVQRRAGAAGWGAWALLWVALVIVEAVLLANHAAADTWAWRATRWFMGDQDAYVAATYEAAHEPANAATAPFYDRVPSPMHGRVYKRTENFWRLFRDMGEPYIIVGLMAILWIYDARGWRAAVTLLVAGAVAGGIGALIAVTAGRYRPIVTDGANVWQFLRGFHPHAGDLSWPSGHSTLAFSLAAALTVLSPRGKWLFIVLAALCAVTRVVMQAHFWSDVAFGGVLGWTVGWWVAVGVERGLVRTPSN